MPSDRYETVMIADNGTETDLSAGSGHAAPLSEMLVSALGRLAIKEALTEAPAEDAAPPENQVDAPGYDLVPMGKPLQLINDHFYFLARCPATGEILDAIPDDSAGVAPPARGEWRVSCSDCRMVHALDLSTIRSERFTVPASSLDASERGPD